MRCAACVVVLAWAGVAGCGQTENHKRDAAAMDAGDAFEAGEVDASIIDSGAADAGPPDSDAADADPGDAGNDAGPPCTVPIVRALTLPSDSAAGMLTGASGSESTWCTPTGTLGPEQAYALHVDAETGAVVRVTSALDTTLSIRETACDWMAELACNDDESFLAHDPAIRAVLAPGDYVVLVDAKTRDTSGDYTLTLETFVPEPGATCEHAVAVTDGFMLSADLAGAGSAPRPISCFAGDALSTDLMYFHATVPAGGRLVATTTGVGLRELRVLDSCDAAPVCLANDRNRVEWVNPGAAAADVILVVAQHPFSRGPTTFDLLIQIVSPSAGASCAAPRVVADGENVRESTTTSSGASAPSGCFGGATGFPDLLDAHFYAATLIPGEELRAEAFALGPYWQPLVAIVDGCGATATCLGGSAFPVAPLYGDRGGAAYTNTGAVPRTVVVAIGRGGTDAGIYDATFHIGAAPGNESCTAATTLTDGTRLSLEDATVGRDDLSTVCLPAAWDGVVYYRASIPVGASLDAVAIPFGDWTPSIRVLTACGAPACARFVQAPRSTTAAKLSYANPGASPLDVWLAVGPADRRLAGRFDLWTAIGAAPYAETSITPACADMSGAPTVAGIVADDSVSATIALPFTPQYFGVAVTHASITSNGFLGLHESAADPPVVPLPATTDPLPGEHAPNGFIAPFWDDLAPVAGTSSVRTLTGGTAPARTFVVEWSRFAVRGDPTSSYTFQAQLYEASNVIEMHYCAMLGDPSLASGGSALVGIEDMLGFQGVSHSVDRIGSVTTTTALRFTPR